MGHDLRQYARQTNIRLIIGFVMLLFLVGDGLIYLVYGQKAALMGVLCLVVGLFPAVLIALALWVIDWFVKRSRAS